MIFSASRRPLWRLRALIALAGPQLVLPGLIDLRLAQPPRLGEPPGAIGGLDQASVVFGGVLDLVGLLEHAEVVGGHLDRERSLVTLQGV